jgi:glutamine amidotransferase
VPFLGICLGMQLMASTGHEGGVFSGLSIFQGVVKEMSPTPNTRIPHVGWNSVSFLKEHPVLENIPNGSDFYFVHGFEVQDYSPHTLLGTSSHGNEFPAVLGFKNAIGVQFHPEKSQAAGALLLSNFLGWDGNA